MKGVSPLTHPGGPGVGTVLSPSRALAPARVPFAWAPLCLIVLAGGWIQAQPAGIMLGPPTSTRVEVDSGELLLGELNCSACHKAEEAAQARLASRQSPRLRDAGARITPQYLRAYLLDPAKQKPGTTMPDMLHGLSPSEKTEAVDCLVQYLSSLNATNPPAALGADQFRMQEGRRLYHQVGCIACHAPQEPIALLQAKSAGENQALAGQAEATLTELKTSSVPLGNLSQKTTVDQLAKFLMDPLTVRPSGRMPSLSLTESEATAIAFYLLRDQAPGLTHPSSRSLQKIQGLQFEYFEDAFNESAPKFEALTPKATGFVDHFSIDPRQRNNDFGFRFTGTITIPLDGDYTFYCESDDGSRLYLGENLIVKNDGLHPLTEGAGRITLKAGEHPIAVTYFNAGGEWGLKVSYAGPNIAKREIPGSILAHLGQPMVPLGEEKFVPNLEKVARGKEFFASLGCAACHRGQDIPSPQPISRKTLASLKPLDPDGCLSPQVKAGRPRYAFNDSQREALRKTISNLPNFSEPLAPGAQVTRTMAALNCFACHSRDGMGGPVPSRAEYFGVVGEADLGDEGRIPPHLSRVGGKLRPEWLREVLLNKGTVRPYMATRMPQFGRTNLEPLLTAFEKADSAGGPEPATEYSARDAKLGRKLVGREGLSCIACHTFAQYKSLGVPAMDLTMMTKRLKKDWFYRYLIDPPALRPGTRMPSFWPEGKAVNQEILEGNTDRQIDALWLYLSQGRDADVPAGLIHARMELVAENEALIYRNFIEGAGSRAIGVGYPAKANLAFDANELRLALIWQGSFIDASRHRTDRGVGFEPPLGEHVVKMASGPAFAALVDLSARWPETGGKAAGYRMRGYRLDEKRRPTFLYSFRSVEIEDYPVPMAGELDPGLKRTLRLRSEHPAKNLWFRAAVGSSIQPKSDDSYEVDAKLNLKFALPPDARPLIRQSGGRSELLVPVLFSGREASIIEELSW